LRGRLARHGLEEDDGAGGGRVADASPAGGADGGGAGRAGDGRRARPAAHGDGRRGVQQGGGTLVVGTKGKLLYEIYGARTRLLPKSLHDSVGALARKLARIPNELHEMNWVDAANTPITNDAAANEFLTRVPRAGWSSR
jgi:hypothetical protein